MPRPTHDFDWHSIAQEPSEPGQENVSATRDRLRWVLVLFALALLTVFARAVQLELRDGAAHREIAARPLQRAILLPAERGRILARDGSVLAEDRTVQAVAVQFEYLQDPPDPQWLRRKARGRLSRADRRQADKVQAAEQAVRTELKQMHERLAALCRVEPAEWQRRARRIDARVTAMARHVNQRRTEQFVAQADDPSPDLDETWKSVVHGLFAPPAPLPPAPLVIAEQRAFHPLAFDVPSRTLEEIQRQAKAYPGVKIISVVRRGYPQGALAAQWIGHIGAGSPIARIDETSSTDGEDAAIVGRMGIELLRDSALQGRAGRERRTVDRRGRVLASQIEQAPQKGHDVVLTLDAQLQHWAERSLDHALRQIDRAEPSMAAVRGGAAVVLDVRSGEILASASAPRFEPSWFADSDPRVEELLADPRRPLFDRVAKMALPPGSVFKPVTALALMSQAEFDARQPFVCQGYLQEPDQLRCQIFRQLGIGHGPVNLIEALAQSCNVYFFHHATELGAAGLTDWAARCGFGQRSGIDAADEGSGQLPTRDDLRTFGQLQQFAIGQGSFTATPLQVARCYAALANGGHLLKPRLTRAEITTADRGADSVDDASMGDEGAIAELTEANLSVIAEGLLRVVNDPSGTAYETARLTQVTLAGKTGTAQVGADRPDHAWFAGYAPAEAPRVAFVVVLEHAGTGGRAAATVAKSLVGRMQQLGYFGPPQAVEQALAPGKG